MSIESPTALIVEDERIIAFDLADAMTDAGYRVKIAHDAGSAIDLVRQEPSFSAAVIDLCLRGNMQGGDLVRILRAKHPALPICVMTGYTDGLDLPEEVPVLQKPFDYDVLIELLK